MTALEEYEKACGDGPGAVESALFWADLVIESLKVCGNCENCLMHDIDYEGWSIACRLSMLDVDPRDGCAFTPSRWQEREP